MKKALTMLVLSLSALIQAQNMVSGIVTDTNKKPLQGVSIYIQEIDKGTFSDVNGKYSLTNLPNRNVSISFSLVGYRTQNKNIIDVHEQKQLDIQLEQSIFQMDEVIISTPFNSLQSQNVIKVERETIKNLTRKGAVTLIDGLATIPGVSQITTGASIGKPVIRGLSSNRVVVYSQGVRLENQQFGDEHGLGLNDAGIESVEVIKSPTSLLYGSDALGGVLFFNPEKFAPANTVKTNFTQRAMSNTLGSQTSLGVKTSAEDWKFLVRGTYNTHSDYRTAGGERVTNTRYNETDFKTGLGYSNKLFSSSLRYNYNRLNLGIPEEGIAEQSSSKHLLSPRQAIENHLLSLNNVFFFKKSKAEVDLGYNVNDRSEFGHSHVEGGDNHDHEHAIPNLRMKLTTLSYTAKYYLPVFARLETIVGIQGMNQTNKNSAQEYLIPNAVTNDFGFFGTAKHQWKSNVLQAGLRFDNRKIKTEAQGILGEEGSFEKIDKSYDSFNASVGYKTNLMTNVIMRLNLASGFRSPNLSELTSNGVHEGTNRYETGSSDLKVEQGLQTDLGLEYKTNHVDFFVNGFNNQISNFIYLQDQGIIKEENQVFKYVQSNANLYGGEIGLHLHPHPLDWLHLETSFESVTGKKQNGDYLPLIPANRWNSTLRVEFNDTNRLKESFATISLLSTFNQDKVSGFETQTSGYNLLNLGLGGTFHFGKNRVEVNLNGNNVLDKKYIAHLSRLKTDGIPNIGRNIILSLNYSL